MEKNHCHNRPLPDNHSVLLKRVRVRPLSKRKDIKRCLRKLDKHHYLKGLKTVGERVFYAIEDENGDWLGVAVFMSAARRLRHRDEWIGWSDEQRRRRLPLVVNNARFLLLPHKSVPNLGSVALKLLCNRISDDWMERYGHPVAIVETFVDPEFFSGAVYNAAGWCELGLTNGSGRVSRDYYERHDRPKRLFVRELVRNARRSLQADKLKPLFAPIEEKTLPRFTRSNEDLGSLKDCFEKEVPDYHVKRCLYPVHALLTIMAAAHLSGSPRGQKDLAKFAKSLSQSQRRAVGIRRRPGSRHYSAPDQSSFSRMMSRVDLAIVEKVLIGWQARIRGPVPEDEIIAIDGKVPAHSGGKNIVTAIASPSQHYLGCSVTAEGTNEISAARELCGKIDIDGKLVSLDAIHTQVETSHIIVENGGHYLYTVKDNQPQLRALIEKKVEDPATPFLT
ncbi:MAG: ISAs1 family transposase [Opitutales bacterium]